VHSKKQLTGLLDEICVEDDRAKTLRKDDFVTFVLEAAAERRWAPAALSWITTEVEAPVADEPGEEPNNAIAA